MVRVLSFALFGLCTSSDMTLKSVMKDQGAALEAEYRQLLQNAINRGKNPNDQAYVPNQDHLSEAEKLFGFLKNDLQTQRDENQELIDHANQQVAKCNDNANSFFDAPDTGINALKKKQQDARTTHSDCRGVEETKIEKYRVSKEDFDSQNSAGCVQEQDWWADTGNDAGSFNALVAAGVEAHTDKNNKEAQEAQCDKDQQAFESAFCKYAALLDHTCGEYDTCYVAKTESRNDIGGTVVELETSQKLVWKMIQKIECYIDKLQNAPNQMPTDADMRFCVNMVPNAGDLNITYTEAPGRITCDTSPAQHKPGSAGFEAQEYSTEPMATLIDGSKAPCAI